MKSVCKDCGYWEENTRDRTPPFYECPKCGCDDTEQTMSEDKTETFISLATLLFIGEKNA